MRVYWPPATEETCPAAFEKHQIILNPIMRAAGEGYQGGDYAAVEFWRYPCTEYQPVSYTRIYYPMFGMRYGQAEYIEEYDDEFRDIFMKVFPDGSLELGYYKDGVRIIKNKRAPDNEQAWHQEGPRPMGLKIWTFKDGEPNPDKPYNIYIDNIEVTQ